MASPAPIATSTQAAPLLPLRWEYVGKDLILRNGHQGTDGKVYDLRIRLLQKNASCFDSISLAGRAIPAGSDAKVQKLFHAMVQTSAKSLPLNRLSFLSPVGEDASYCGLSTESGFVGNVGEQKLTSEASLDDLLEGDATVSDAMQGIHRAIFPERLVTSQGVVQPRQLADPNAPLTQPTLVETAPSSPVSSPVTVSRSPSPVKSLKAPPAATAPFDAETEESVPSPSPLKIEEASLPVSRPLSAPASFPNYLEASIEEAPPVAVSTAPVLPKDWKQSSLSVLYAFEEEGPRLAEDAIHYAHLQGWDPNGKPLPTPKDSLLKAANEALLGLADTEAELTKSMMRVGSWLRDLRDVGVRHLLRDKKEACLQAFEKKHKRGPQSDEEFTAYLKRRVVNELIYSFQVFKDHRVDVSELCNQLVSVN